MGGGVDISSFSGKSPLSEGYVREIWAKSTLRLSGLGSGQRQRVDPEHGFFAPSCKAGLGATEWVKDNDSTPLRIPKIDIFQSGIHRVAAQIFLRFQGKSLGSAGNVREI